MVVLASALMAAMLAPPSRSVAECQSDATDVQLIGLYCPFRSHCGIYSIFTPGGV